MQELSFAAAAAVLVAVAGIWLAVKGLRGTAPDPGKPPSVLQERWRRLRAEMPPAWRANYRWLAAAAVAAAAATWAVTGWPVHGLAAAGAVLGLPYVLNPGGNSKQRIEKLEALSQWLYHLAGIHSAGLTLTQTIARSAKSAPEPIAGPIQRLAAKLRAGMDTPQEAFEDFAEELHDGVVDHITLLFMTHAKASGSGLSDALEALARSIAQSAEDARNVDADRETVRRSTRTVSLFFLGFAGLCMLNKVFMAPYGTFGGQIFLACIAAGFVYLLARMRQVARAKPEPRLLNPKPKTGAAAAASTAATAERSPV
nr:type II secretion system F family protein [Streptomyces coryli]